MAMIEAMSCGLPCIVPDDADITTLAKHEYNALVVPVGDTEGFANSISRLLTDQPLYDKLTQNARKIVTEKKEEYSLQNISVIWRQILTTI